MIGRPNIADDLSPHSNEAEEALLGSILINPEGVFEVASFLQPSAFFIVGNRWIYEAICTVKERGDAVNNLTVIQELQNRNQLESIGGSVYVTRLMHDVRRGIHTETYGHIVERAAIRRQLPGINSL